MSSKQLKRANSLGAISVQEEGSSDEEDASPRLPPISSRSRATAASNGPSGRPSSAGAGASSSSSFGETAGYGFPAGAPARAAGAPMMMRAHSSPVMSDTASRLRPSTAPAERTGGLKTSQSFAVGTRVLEGTGRTVPAGGLPTINEDPASASLGVYVSRGGLRRPKSAYVFSTARRDDSVGLPDGATVPFHYAPPELLARDPTTMVKNAPKVPFSMSLREAYYPKAASLAAAGPGAYDPNVDMMSTKRMFPTLSFTTAKRPGLGGAEGGPGPYDVKFIEKHTPQLKMSTSSRPESRSATSAGPGSDVKFIEKHTYSYRFSDAPREGKGMYADPATAAVPLRGGERVKKHKPSFRFSTASRWGPGSV